MSVSQNVIGIVRDSEERYSLLNPTFFIFGEKDHTISLDQVSCCSGKTSFPIVHLSYTEILVRNHFHIQKIGWMVLFIFQLPPYLV